jgi:hypothetical protein
MLAHLCFVFVFVVGDGLDETAVTARGRAATADRPVDVCEADVSALVWLALG